MLRLPCNSSNVDSCLQPAANRHGPSIQPGIAAGTSSGARVTGQRIQEQQQAPQKGIEAQGKEGSIRYSGFTCNVYTPCP